MYTSFIIIHILFHFCIYFVYLNLFYTIVYNVWQKLESFCGSCYLRRLSCLHLLHWEHPAQPQHRTALMKNCFILGLLSTHIITLEPNPQKYFLTSFLTLPLCAGENGVSLRGCRVCFPCPACVCRLKQTDDPANSLQIPVTLQDISRFSICLPQLPCKPNSSLVKIWLLCSGIALFWSLCDHKWAKQDQKVTESHSMNFLSQPSKEEGTKHLCTFTSRLWNNHWGLENKAKFPSEEIIERIVKYL